MPVIQAAQQPQLVLRPMQDQHQVIAPEEYSHLGMWVAHPQLETNTLTHATQAAQQPLLVLLPLMVQHQVIAQEEYLLLGMCLASAHPLLETNILTHAIQMAQQPQLVLLHMVVHLLPTEPVGLTSNDHT